MYKLFYVYGMLGLNVIFSIPYYIIEIVLKRMNSLESGFQKHRRMSNMNVEPRSLLALSRNLFDMYPLLQGRLAGTPCMK